MADWTVSEAKKGAKLARELGMNARCAVCKHYDSFVSIRYNESDIEQHKQQYKLWIKALKDNDIECKNRITKITEE
jgi:uncharacterized protein involved in tolerance to divalent cations